MPAWAWAVIVLCGLAAIGYLTDLPARRARRRLAESAPIEAPPPGGPAAGADTEYLGGLGVSPYRRDPHPIRDPYADPFSRDSDFRNRPGGY